MVHHGRDRLGRERRLGTPADRLGDFVQGSLAIDEQLIDGQRRDARSFADDLGLARGEVEIEQAGMNGSKSAHRLPPLLMVSLVPATAVRGFNR